MPILYSYKNTKVRIGPKPMIDYYDYLYNSNTYLKIYLTFDNAVGSDGGTYSSGGTIYIPNLAPGANNTSDTTGSLFKLLSTSPPSQLSTSTKKWGASSFYLYNGVIRNNSKIILPSNTGLTFTIWCNFSINTYSYFPLFGVSVGGSPYTALSLRLCGSVSTTPWTTLNYQVDSDGVGIEKGINLSTPVSINANEWNHYAWTISPAVSGASCTHTFYINGVLLTSVSGKYPVASERLFFDIGGQDSYAPSIGYFDTFRYYETALTASDINAMYNYADPINLM